MDETDRVRQALAMRDAGYSASPSPEDVAALLHTYYRLNAALADIAAFSSDRGSASCARAAVTAWGHTNVR